MCPDQKKTANTQLRFVLLRHAIKPTNGRVDHWDLMLEHEGSLVTFELTRLPSEPGVFEAQRLPDHRLHYLEFEGDIDGNRGHVVRLDRGHWQFVSDGAVHRSGPVQYQLQGERLTASFSSNTPIHTLPFAQISRFQAIRWEWDD